MRRARAEAHFATQATAFHTVFGAVCRGRGAIDLRLWPARWQRRVLRQRVSDVVPGCFRANKDVHAAGSTATPIKIAIEIVIKIAIEIAGRHVHDVAHRRRRY